MSLSNLLQQLKGGTGSGNFGHSGRPGHKGGSVGGSKSGGSSFSTAAGEASVGDVVQYMTPLMRNRGTGQKAGIVMSAPDKEGFMKIAPGSVQTTKHPSTIDVHISDVQTIPGTKGSFQVNGDWVDVNGKPMH